MVSVTDLNKAEKGSVCVGRSSPFPHMGCLPEVCGSGAKPATPGCSVLRRKGDLN
jgi:hypothetical protein